MERHGQVRHRRLVGLFIVASLITPITLLAGAGTATAATVTFSFTGAEQDFQVPAGVCQVTIDAFGAEGGFVQASAESDAAGTAAASGPTTADARSTSPGLGGEAMATINVVPGTTLRVFVGGQGGTGTTSASASAGSASASATLGLGGFNGGGDGAAASDHAAAGTNEFGVGAATGVSSGGGGGASDVRIATGTLPDRILVAGGGGGAGGAQGPTASTPPPNGFITFFEPGLGGEGNGGNGTAGGGSSPGGGGAGGGSNSGGAAGTGSGTVATNGVLGAGGDGGSSHGTQSTTGTTLSASAAATVGGGGGGGLFGGGGGGAATVTNGIPEGSGGGGGAGSGFGPPGTVFTDAVRSGDGHVTITAAATGVGCAPTLQVRKVVSGTATVGFTEHVTCTAPTSTSQATTATADVDLVFNPDGTPNLENPPAGWTITNAVWQHQALTLVGSTCIVTETASGGAASVSFTCNWTPSAVENVQGAGCPGASSGPNPTSASVTLEGGADTGLLTVTNTFPPHPIPLPASAVVVQPTFTG